ncbi:ATP-grasp domain-containing protein [Streptomyces sp. 6N223]|uniref:ATP-grasp domain-containing protein n=1 Tax=Streptomyces sp. 6N223 TaxID=3457412 RepID=UPI003FD617E1
MTIAALELLTFGLGRLVEASRDAGHRLCLLTRDRAVYRHELGRLPDGALDVVDVDTLDADACAAALSGVTDLAGLINSTDTFSVPGADLAAKLGLPGPDPAAVRLIRDKAHVRNLLHARGLSRLAARLVDPGDPAAADAVLGAVGLPAVLKDTAGTSSRGVWLVRDEEALRAALRAASRTPLRGRLLAEPFAAGPVYSAETLSWDGRTRLLGVLSRQMSPEPAVREEAAAFPVALPRQELARIEEWAGALLAAVGHDAGFAHVEFVHTADGPELVEINRRIGGALVGEALCRRLATNVYAALVDATLGHRPALLDASLDAGPATGFVLVHPSRTGTLTGWRGLDTLHVFPGGPEWYPTAEPGDPVEHLHDQRGCTGIVLAEAATAELALHRALAAAGSIRPTVEG